MDVLLGPEVAAREPSPNFQKAYMRSILFLLLLFCAPLCLGQEHFNEILDTYNTRSIPYISVEELRMLQHRGEVVVLDARESNEYSISHIPNATYVGYSEFSPEEALKAIPNKSTPIVVYCSLGIRSEDIGEKLKKAGYENVKNLYGGIFEWKNKEFPVVNRFEKETDSVHTCTKLWSKWLKKGIKVYE